jgi:hypothetical protein
LHASKTYDKAGHLWLVDNGFIVPPDLKTGGIKAHVEMTDCLPVTDELRAQSIFATGPHCLVFEDPKPYRFLPCSGQLAVPFKADLYDLRHAAAKELEEDETPLYG